MNSSAHSMDNLGDWGGDDFLHLFRLLESTARRILGKTEEADEAVQQALLKAWSKRDTLKNSTVFRSWLSSILINECRNTLRARQKRIGPLPDKLNSSDAPWDPAEKKGLFFEGSSVSSVPEKVEPEIDRKRHLVDKILEQLHPNERTAFVLKAWGWSYRDIAAHLGIDILVVTRILARASYLIKDYLRTNTSSDEGT
jgi:RNA polymerase sigma-70 factor (ECF subfamily)